MKVVFLSNIITPHQTPLCNMLFALCGEEFLFIETMEVSGELPIGWKTTDVFPYVKKIKDLPSHTLQKLLTDADVVVSGSAPDELILKRLKSRKLTFKYSERFYKNGTPWRRYLRDAAAAWLHHGRFHKYPLYMLCASAYTAGDAARFGNYKKRCYRWGYFPETKQYDMEELFAEKQNEIPKILWCGRFLELKHPDDAICVAERLKKDGYRFVLNLIGTGDLQSQLERMIEEKNLGDCVHLLGSMKPEQVREHMEQANIYLFTSDRQEGWGAVLNESMNSGCAVVASHAIGSVPFLLKDGENGLIYESGNLDMLYRKVKYLLDDPAEQRSLGETAYLTILEEWNAEVASKRLIDLSERLICGEKYPDIFKTGPCSRANIINDGWKSEKI